MDVLSGMRVMFFVSRFGSRVGSLLFGVGFCISCSICCIVVVGGFCTFSCLECFGFRGLSFDLLLLSSLRALSR